MTLTEEEEIAQWEEILKERYTSKDKAYTDHLAKPRKGPPVVEAWYPRNGAGMNRKRPARRDDRWGGGGGGGSGGDRRQRYDGGGPPEKRRSYHDYRSR